MTARFPALLLALVGCVLLSGAVRAADDLEESNKLLRQGNYAQALDRVNAFLNANPKDAKARFLKGLILTEQGKSGEAIKIFTALTEDYPELPEPYNNLAVLYASQGEYAKARTALEMAIRTHPSYATAHENLGDIYAKMASQAYDKALQLDRNNKAAQTKLELIKELFSNSPRALRPAAAKSDPAKAQVAMAPAAKPAEEKAAQAPAKPPAETAKPAEPATTGATAPRPAAEPPLKVATAPATSPRTASPAGSPDEVLNAVKGWASAWSNNDVAGYLAYYAADFKPGAGQSRADWEKLRSERIAKPRKIEVIVQSPTVEFTDAGRATVSFRQTYRSGNLRQSSNKKLYMVKADGKWLIEQEQVAH